MADPAGPDVFSRARFRLALLFAGIVIILVVASSVITYLNVRSDLQTAARGAFTSGETEQEFVTRSLGTFRWRLLAVDGVVILVVGIGGLLYARSTLRPIRDNVAAQKRFIADASHELRTPLTIMKTDFQVALRDPLLAEEAGPVLRSGLEEVDRMTGMVEDLLTLSRIDAHQEQLADERFDLAALARETAQKLAGVAAARGVTIRAGGADTAPAAGDERHTQRALANVVKNALEHSLPGGAVEVQAVAAVGTSSVTVTDHGEGIAPGALEHIFDRFYRADPARSQEHGGSGLGLAIARWALRRMGGDLVADSTVGSGTSMTLTLPTPRS
ncbi:MAG: HAMP domain-containing sensor histidine kinase [Actinobacteria bacterium]|nr:HAMP domain-containing sensor histidine kinase [Actinomycetota bacterium]